MKKTVVYTLSLIILLAVACKPSTPKTNPEEEAKKAAEERQKIETACYTAIEAHFKTTTLGATSTLDTLIIESIDSATEKMAAENYCMLTLNVKNAVDNYVEKQQKVVDAAKKVSPILAEPEQNTLNQALEKQSRTNKEYEDCQEKLKTTDDSQYNYYKVITQVLHTQEGKTDTLKSNYFIDKEFKVKTF